jgi:hypothetical protein
MIMVADLLPHLKRFLKPVPFSDAARVLAIRVIVAFVLHAGRMSCLVAAGAVRCDSRVLTASVQWAENRIAGGCDEGCGGLAKPRRGRRRGGRVQRPSRWPEPWVGSG